MDEKRKSWQKLDTTYIFRFPSPLKQVNWKLFSRKDEIIELRRRQNTSKMFSVVPTTLDCKTVGFFLKISKGIGKAWWGVSPQSRSLFSASFQTFCLTARAYLNTQKYGLFCSLRLRETAQQLTGARKLLCFSAQSEVRTAATIWNWSGRTLSPVALLAVLDFSSCRIFPPV